MNSEQRRYIESFLRMNNFGMENSAEIPVDSPAKPAFETIEGGLSQLSAKGITRTSALTTKFSKTAHRQTLRQSLLDDFRDIVRTARVLGKTNPIYEDKFRLLRSRPPDLQLLEIARAFAADAEPLKNDFIRYGLPPDFLEDLIADADAFAQVINEQDSANRQKVDANASIGDIMGEMLDAREILTVVIPNIFRDNAGKLADWATASHVARAPQHPKEPTA